MGDWVVFVWVERGRERNRRGRGEQERTQERGYKNRKLMVRM